MTTECTCPHRRRLLGGVASGAISALLPPGVLFAQGGGGGTGGLIDVHHHIGPKFFGDAVSNFAPEWAGWSPQRALEEMDSAGVSTSVVSYTQPGTWLGDAPRSAAFTRRCNEYAAQLARDHPGRFGFFASLPLPDTDGSLKEIEYAFETLHADGIGLMTSYDGKWLGDAAFEPTFAELDRRRAVVYVHPTAPACCTKLMGYVPPNLTEFVQDTNRAMTSLIFSGALPRLRNVRFVFSHAGGGVPLLAGRIHEIMRRRAELGARVPDGIHAELRRFYYEVANSTTRGPMTSLTSIVPMSQIMFGSDYPLFPIATTADGLRHLDLSATDLIAVRRGNALRLLAQLQR